MELVALAKNPAPSGATTGIFKSSGGAEVALCALGADAAAEAGHGVRVPGAGRVHREIFRGRCRSAPARLRRSHHGLARAGRLERALFNPCKGYVRSFAEYDQDLAHFMKEIVLPDCQPPYIALAHSMGGHILLRNATLPGLLVLAHGPERADDRHRRGPARRPAGGVARLRRDPRRPRARLHVRAQRPRRAHGARTLRGQPAHLRSRALSAQPAGARGGPGARPRLADRRLAARRAALDRQADRPALSVARGGAAAAVRRRHGHRSSRRRRSRSSRCA